MPNTNHIQIDGNNNLALQGIHNSTVNITHSGGSTVLPTELTTTLPKTDLSKIIGRDQDLQQVQELLQQKQKVVVVNGLGGIGKTTLAQAYLTRYSGEYAHLLWVAQSEGDNFMLDLLNAPGLTLNLGIDTQGKDAPAIFTEIVARLKSIAADKPCLLVIDNANVSLQGHFDHLPKPPHWHVLATSRERMERFYPKDLDFLSEADAVALFRQHCRRITDEADIKAVLKTIDYHTLTIEILAKTAQRHDTSLTALQAAIERDLASGVYIPHNKGEKIERVASYLLSIFDLATLSAEEQRLLQHFTALPTEFVPYELLKTLIPEGEEGGIAPGLQDLADKGWLLSQAEPEAYKIHRIIQEVVKRKLPPSVEGLSELIRRVGDLLNIDQTKDNPADKSPVVPYGEAILLLFPDAKEEVLGYLQNELGRVFQALGDYSAARALYEKAVHSAETSLGTDHTDTAIVYSNLGTLLHAQGDYNAAKTLLEKAVRSNEASFGEDDPETAIRYSNLALVLQEIKEYTDAEFLLKKTVRIMEAHYGANHPYVGKSYSNLAALLLTIEDYSGAKTLLEKAIHTHEINFGKNHPTTAISYSNLSMAFRGLGDYDKAKTLLEKALRSDEVNFGENHPNTAVRYHNLGMVLKDLGKYKKAIRLVIKAHRIYSSHYGQQHPNTKKIEKSLNIVAEKMLENGWTEEQIETLKNE